MATWLLPTPLGPERDHVLAPRDELTAREFHHQRLVERWDGVEVEAVQALERREPGRLDPAFNRARLAIEQLQFDQARQIADMVHVLGGALPSDLLMLPRRRRQLQPLEMMAKQNLRRLRGGAHDAFRVSRLIVLDADVVSTVAGGRWG